jgi:branched-chain amino acid aminotransferase group I
MEPPYDSEALTRAVVETIRANGLKECYVRPIVLRGYGTMSVNPTGAPVDTYVAVWEWGAYLGKDAIENGVDVCVSSWARSAPNTFPSSAKAGGHYLNSQLIKMEAIANGYAEGIALDPAGYVSEGSGENLFLVRDGVLYTPSAAQSVLPGITRGSVLRIAGTLGHPEGVALHFRRIVLHRNGRRNHADTVGGQDSSRPWEARPHHDSDPDEVLRDNQREGGTAGGLAVSGRLSTPRVRTPIARQVTRWTRKPWPTP